MNERGNKEFLQFLSFSKASLAECKSQIYRSLDRKYINEVEFNIGIKEADELKVGFKWIHKLFKKI
jgi:four helix bundle protein